MRGNRDQNNWTLERSELAATMWKDGYSASVIAARLGIFTRNSVIGKVMRMGLARRQGPVTFRMDGKTLKPNLGKNQFTGRTARKPKAPKLKVEPIPEAPAIFTTEYFRTIGQIENEHCRWPCWEEGATADQQFYCGTPTADVADGRSWCGYHARIAYTPAQPRKSVKHWATFGKRQAAA